MGATALPVIELRMYSVIGYALYVRLISGSQPHPDRRRRHPSEVESIRRSATFITIERCF